MLLKNSSFCTTHNAVLFQYRFYREDHVYLTYLMLQRQLSHLNGRELHFQFEAYCIFKRNLALIVVLITFRNGTRRKHLLVLYFNRFCGNMFV
jgi:hypothetical protein